MPNHESSLCVPENVNSDAFDDAIKCQIKRHSVRESVCVRATILRHFNYPTETIILFLFSYKSVRNCALAHIFVTRSHSNAFGIGKEI